MVQQPLNPDDLVTVDEYARRYRVQTSVVRSWIRNGHIPYKLVGPRHMQVIRIRPSETFVRIPLVENRRKLIAVYVSQGVDEDTAANIIGNLNDHDVDSQLSEMIVQALHGGANGTAQATETQQDREGRAEETSGAAERQSDGRGTGPAARRDAKRAGQATGKKAAK